MSQHVDSVSRGVGDQQAALLELCDVKRRLEETASRLAACEFALAREQEMRLAAEKALAEFVRDEEP